MSTTESRTIKLYGRVILTGDIRLITGLHIGGAPAAIAIGGLDNPVVRDPVTNQPYIPGSSLRGKMRSLSEKFLGAPQNRSIGEQVKIHICKDESNYARCPVCRVFGVPGELEFSQPTRLVVRDVYLAPGEADRLYGLKTDLPYTEVKWEAAIDRVTSAAVPRQVERVPAGTVFSPFEMVMSIYQGNDRSLFRNVVEAMQLLEDDYLGGMGSRGSGKINFERLALTCKPQNGYLQPAGERRQKEYKRLADLVNDLEGAIQWLSECIPVE